MCREGVGHCREATGKGSPQFCFSEKQPPDVAKIGFMQGIHFKSSLSNLGIVAEVGGLFLHHSPDKVRAIQEAAEKSDAGAIQLAAHSLKSSSAYIGATHLSALAKELEMMGRSSTPGESQRWRGEAALSTSASRYTFSR